MQKGSSSISNISFAPLLSPHREPWNLYLTGRADLAAETIVLLEDGYAECFVSGEFSGDRDPPSVTKTAVSRREWRFLNEQWSCI